MKNWFSFGCKKDVTIVSANTVNQISEYLIAKVETEEELGDLLMEQFDEQEARKEAWKLAYKEIPLTTGNLPLDVRREIQEKRNSLAEKFYQEIVNKKK